jgi:hypothetical protein
VSLYLVGTDDQHGWKHRVRSGCTAARVEDCSAERIGMGMRARSGVVACAPHGPDLQRPGHPSESLKKTQGHSQGRACGICRAISRSVTHVCTNTIRLLFYVTSDITRDGTCGAATSPSCTAVALSEPSSSGLIKELHSMCNMVLFFSPTGKSIGEN